MIVPLREEVVVFAATVKLTVPLPVPLLDVVINGLLLTAVQLQPLPVKTVKLKLSSPPADLTFALVGLIAKEHAAS